MRRSRKYINVDITTYVCRANGPAPTAVQRNAETAVARGAVNTSGATIAKRRQDTQQASRRSPSTSVLTGWTVKLPGSLFESTAFLRGSQLQRLAKSIKCANQRPVKLLCWSSSTMLYDHRLRHDAAPRM